MLDGSAAIALGAGTLAALNPCGFALLPAYLTLLITGDDQPSPPAAVLRAVRMTAAMTAGFATVFAVFGLAIIPVASSVQQYLPWFSLSVGLLLVGAGVWQLSGRTLALPTLWRRKGAPVTATLGSMFGFGVAYAMASLTCTIAPFLAVVVSAFRADDVTAGLVLFGLYAAGMGLVVGSAAIAVALAQGAVVRGARRVGHLVPTLGAGLLVVVGAYVAYYGWWEIRVLRGGNPDDPVIDAALGAQAWLANAVQTVGATGFAIVFGLLLIAVLTPVVLRSRRVSQTTKPGSR
ncbi:MAG: cytochrome c biogenesis CcdA family protein [Ornithinimicrobium sp.]